MYEDYYSTIILRLLAEVAIIAGIVKKKRSHSIFCILYESRLYLQGEDFSPESCEALLYSGWRRCGSLFYQICEKPQNCIPRMIITLVNDFKPSRSQRHVCIIVSCNIRL